MPADQQSQESESMRSPRFVHWIAFLVISLIVMTAAVDASESSQKSRAVANQKWAITSAVFTFFLTLVVVVMHIFPVSSIFITGTKLEGALCLILIVLWCTNVAIISDSKNGLAVNEEGAVFNGNLYYFSWAGFVCSITLIVSYLRQAYAIDVAGEIRSRSARLRLWAALMAACLVVMGSSANIFDNDCDATYVDATFCSRTKFAIALGLIGTIISLAVVGMKIATTMAPFLFEAGSALSLFICYIFGVAYITSENGPGAPLGNLYYSTWAAFVTTFMIGSSCFEDYQAAKAMTAQQNLEGHEQGQDGRGDIQIESLDHI
mmetsp:Transcript_49209/g.73174  ORF Transcript_49209/g.73174 Transcript_49209/m.73174 type:complete len:320 (+) Transcript_49209:75-1034(+)|eukprot:CAMPEP_0195522728 /NCGR_PEP_ID=MMETSP0794_2-20130614/21173_1 /TAXON_ID=515487 /ORGANISM="Stephanopyxis turris, Strain CCMP 815" /LENGTH=319 /DNA_ID=CAMNT_0040652557 /DNA_START=70 /DNA_END=1029 /DNA_ORIENTATION=-